jgi:hypothetical protein
VNKRLALLLILIVGLVALLVAWPRLSKELTIADVSLAALSQPREEVVVSGYVKNFGATPFSLETLSIEEPGKEPYHRQVSLDANRTFELTLGKPSPGTYRVALRTRKRQWGGGVQEGWLKLPNLVVEGQSSARGRPVQARDYDYPRLFIFGGLGFAVVAALALVGLWPRAARIKT